MSFSAWYRVPVGLSANTPMPAGNTVSSGQLADVTLFWPTDGAFPNGRCPTSEFVPSSIQIIFGDRGSSTVRNTFVDGREVAVCGQHINIECVGSLGPTK